MACNSCSESNCPCVFLVVANSVCGYLTNTITGNGKGSNPYVLTTQLNLASVLSTDPDNALDVVTDVDGCLRIDLSCVKVREISEVLPGPSFTFSPSGGGTLTPTGASGNVLVADGLGGLYWRDYTAAGTGQDCLAGVSGTWGVAPLNFACPDSAGAPLYCAPDGLRTAPEHRVVAFHQDTALSWPDNIPSTPLVVGSTASQTSVGGYVGTITNPSASRSMICRTTFHSRIIFTGPGGPGGNGINPTFTNFNHAFNVNNGLNLPAGIYYLSRFSPFSLRPKDAGGSYLPALYNDPVYQLRDAISMSDGTTLAAGGAQLVNVNTLIGWEGNLVGGEGTFRISAFCVTI